MPEKSPLKKLFDELKNLLKLIQENRHTPQKTVTPEVAAMVEALERKVTEFCATTDKLFPAPTMSEWELRKALRKIPAHLATPEMLLLNQAQELKKQVEEVHSFINEVPVDNNDFNVVKLSDIESDKPDEKKKKKKKEEKPVDAQQRKNMFRPLGGKRGWNRL